MARNPIDQELERRATQESEERLGPVAEKSGRKKQDGLLITVASYDRRNGKASARRLRHLTPL